MEKQISKELLDFIEKSPTAFHVVDTMKEMLEMEGFVSLQENSEWNLKSGGKYYVTRNGSSIIAFTVPEVVKGFHIVASHSDSPTFKIKEIPEICVADKYTKLNVEGYGGMIMSSWLDRPLSAAGRILVKTENGVAARLVNVNKDLLIIPNVAIHMNRGVNEGYKWNIQKDLLPLYGNGNAKGTFMDVIAENACVETDQILDHRQRDEHQHKSDDKQIRLVVAWGVQTECTAKGLIGGVLKQGLDDLAEGKGDDGKIVASQAQSGDAYDHTAKCGCGSTCDQRDGKGSQSVTQHRHQQAGNLTAQISAHAHKAGVPQGKLA